MRGGCPFLMCVICEKAHEEDQFGVCQRGSVLWGLKGISIMEAEEDQYYEG